MMIMIYGKRKQGKSTLAFSIAIAEHPRVLVFDPSGNFPTVRTIKLDQVRDWLNKFQDAEVGSEYTFARVTGFRTEDIPEAFAEFCDALFDGDTFEHELSVIVDEAHMLQGRNYIDPNLDRIQRKVPSDSTLIETTHRIVDSDVNTRYHVDVFFFFYADLDRELKKIREDFGPEIAERVSQLKQYEVIEWKRPQGQQPVMVLWDEPKAWYVDLKNQNR
jgi:hypothetical protein